MEATATELHNSSAEVRNSSLLGLVRGFTRETKTFFKQEVDLAKTELAEKAKTMASGATNVAVGGFVAYAGAIVLLIGLGELLAFPFTKAGLDSVLAQFIGLGIIGLVVAVIGVAVLMTALKKLSADQLAPKRTLHTIHELRGQELETEKPEPKRPKVSTEELEHRVERTEQRMGETLDELIDRVSPRQVSSRVRHKIQERPYRAGMLVMIVGMVSGLMLRRKFSRA